VFPNGCPSGSTHTATMYIYFSSGGHPATGSSVGASAQTLNAVATADTEDCDPIFGNPTAPECQSTLSGAVNCSVMGGIFSGILNSPVTLAIAVTDYIFTDIVGRECEYYLYCPNGNTSATCPGDNPVLVNSTQNVCKNYLYDERLRIKAFGYQFCTPVGRAFLTTVAHNCS